MSSTDALAAIAPKRRVGAESSETRAAIISAAETVIRDEGYGAASTRRVAQFAGLKPSLVHYYFPTTDDLLLAVFRKGADQSDAMIEEALASDDPLSALWGFFSDNSRTAISLEFLALATHRPAIRKHIAEHSEAMRARKAEILQKLLGPALQDRLGCSPEALSLILAGIGRVLVMEGGLGVEAGHEEARKWVGQWLATLKTKDKTSD